jgi:hypothetical protein
MGFNPFISDRSSRSARSTGGVGGRTGNNYSYSGFWGIKTVSMSFSAISQHYLPVLFGAPEVFSVAA